MKYPNGSESILSSGPWMQLIAIRGAICSDGKPRYAKITGQADTYFSCPARVKVNGKSVTGFISCDNNGYTFTASSFLKNAALLPKRDAYDIAALAVGSVNHTETT